MFRLIAVFLCILVLFTACSTVSVESSSVSHEAESSSASSAVEQDTDTIGSSEPESSAAESTTESETEEPPVPNEPQPPASDVTPKTDFRRLHSVQADQAGIYLRYLDPTGAEAIMLWCDFSGTILRQETMPLYQPNYRFPTEPTVRVERNTGTVYFYDGEEVSRVYTPEREAAMTHPIAVFGEGAYLLYVESEDKCVLTLEHLQSGERQIFTVSEWGYSGNPYCWAIEAFNDTTAKLSISNSEHEEDALYLSVPELTRVAVPEEQPLVIQSSLGNADWIMLYNGFSEQALYPSNLYAGYNGVLDMDGNLLLACSYQLGKNTVGVYRQPNGEPIWEFSVEELQQRFEGIEGQKETGDLYPVWLSADGSEVLLTNGEQVFRLEIAV